MNGWISIVGSGAAIAFLLVSLALMFQAVAPPQAAKLIVGVIVATLLLIFVPTVVISSWDALPAWQKIAVSALGAAVVLVRRKVRPSRKSVDR